MSYGDDEKSLEDSRPVEIYEVSTPAKIFRLTSYDEDYLHFGQLFTSIPISRGNAQLVNVGKSREMTIRLPVTHELALLLIGGGIPPRDVELTITRIQQRSIAAREIWSGFVNGVIADDQYAQLRVPSGIDDQLRVKLPVLRAQPTCQHHLYLRGCEVARTLNFKQTPTVASFDGVTLVVSSMGGQPSQWATFGEVIRLSDGERRGILDQTGTTLTLDVPFRELVVGDALQVWAGCDLTIETCLAKFGNVPNFGGHPDIGIRRTTAGPIPKKSFIQRIIDHTDGDL